VVFLISSTGSEGGVVVACISMGAERTLEFFDILTNWPYGAQRSSFYSLISLDDCLGFKNRSRVRAERILEQL
jgi:hypothetical protein